MLPADQIELPLSKEAMERLSPALRKVIENPNGAFQRWKRGEIGYSIMCGEFTKELVLARTEFVDAEATKEADQALSS
jgi:hypothetical protein